MSSVAEGVQTVIVIILVALAAGMAAEMEELQNPLITAWVAVVAAVLHT